MNLSDLNNIGQVSLARKQPENVPTNPNGATACPTQRPQRFAWKAPPQLGHKAPPPAAGVAVLRHSRATGPVGTCRCPGASNVGWCTSSLRQKKQQQMPASCFFLLFSSETARSTSTHASVLPPPPGPAEPSAAVAPGAAAAAQPSALRAAGVARGPAWWQKAPGPSAVERCREREREIYIYIIECIHKEYMHTNMYINIYIYIMTYNI